MLKLIALCAFGSLGLTAIAAAASGQGQPPQNPQQAPPPPQMTADLKVGDMAPDFSLQGSDGKLHKLEIKVKKPGMTARARKSYVAEKVNP